MARTYTQLQLHLDFTSKEASSICKGSEWVRQRTRFGWRITSVLYDFSAYIVGTQRTSKVIQNPACREDIGHSLVIDLHLSTPSSAAGFYSAHPRHPSHRTLSLP